MCVCVCLLIGSLQTVSLQEAHTVARSYQHSGGPYLRIPRIHPHTAPVEVDIIRREYGDSTAAYGCLGVLKVNVGTESFSYLVLVTECQSVGKVGGVYWRTGGLGLAYRLLLIMCF